MYDLDSEVRRHTDAHLFQRMTKYIRPHIGKFILAIMLLLVTLAVEVISPMLISILLKMVDGKSLDVAIKTIIIFTTVAIVVVIISFILQYIQNMILQKIGQDVVEVIRQEVFDHIETLTTGQVNQVPIGKLVTRVTNDTTAISEMFTTVLPNLLSNVIFIVGIGGILFFLNWKIALIAIGFIPVIIGGTIVFRKFARRAHRRVRDGLSDINAFLSENLSGIKVTQVFNQEERKKQEFIDKSKKQRNNHFKTITVFSIYRPLIYITTTLATVLVVWVSINEVLLGSLAFLTLSSIYLYIGQFFSPIEQLAELFDVLQEAFSSAEKIFLVLDTNPNINDQIGAIELTDFKGEIEFKNVWFSYIKDEWVLKDISFTVKPGETVAFVGATGSGKTTIMNLIVKNYLIQKGEILIDGININQIKQSSIRKNIGQMLQDVFLFNDTILNNLTMRDNSITLESVIEASKYVGAHDFIKDLPNDYNYMVLERGNNFSSGQRQLLSFARALAYRPNLIILDEATANIDSETEEQIQTSLEKIMNDSTMIIVAHRLSTIQHSNRIIVMHRGEIIESGNHQELLKNKNLYYRLYELQYQEEKENLYEIKKAGN